MLAMKEAIRKFSVLDDEDAIIVINLVDYLSKRQESRDNNSLRDNPFRKIRENGRQFWMSDEEIDVIVETARKERHAARN